MQRSLIIITAGLTALTLSACSNTPKKSEAVDQFNATSEENRRLQSELALKESALQERDQQIASYQQQLAANSSQPSVSTTDANGELLPPNAKTGECYARIWVPTSYRTVTKKMLSKQESERVEVIPGEYAWVEERVLVKEPSTRLETIPAVYGSEDDVVVVQKASRSWKTGLGKSATPASEELLKSAELYGADLKSATPGMCFHEHYRPAEFVTETQQVKTSDATAKIKVIPAQYRDVKKKVLVKEAAYQLKDFPAEYEWVEEKVIDKPAHTVWKKGTGPIQKIDEATGEIMCLVEVPATYKTLRKRVLKRPARTETVEIPAEYKTVTVSELVSPAKEVKTAVPAQFKTIEVTKQISGPAFIWHEVHNTEEPKQTRTGNKVCLTETPEVTKTVKRRVVVTPITTRTIEVPAVYKTMKLRKVVKKPEEKRIKIPAEYREVALQEVEKPGYMEWRSILCETNVTTSRIREIQTALTDAGYKPGPIDGDIGPKTMSAVNAFQRDKNLPVDKYLNIATLQALGISTR